MLLIRKIRRARWQIPDYQFSLLDQDDYQSDPLGDLSTQKGRLSLFFVEDNEENVNRVISALVTVIDLSQVKNG